MERQIKEYASDAYGWPPVSSMKEPKAIDEEDHSGTNTPFSVHTTVQLNAYLNWH